MNSDMAEDKLNVKPLDEIPAGKSVSIVSVEAGQDLKNRLASMGLLVNEKIRVVRNDRAGQIIVQVKHSKVILGRGMSHKVTVAEV